MTILEAPRLHSPEELRADASLFNHSPEQLAFELCQEAIQIGAAGRRGGKTHVIARKGIKAGVSETIWPDWRGFFSAPTRQQAKDLYWNRIKRIIPRKLIMHISESELFIRLYNNAELHVEGLDKMSRIEGQPWNWMSVDETDDTKYNEIEEKIYPMMADRQAQLIFGGVPNGRYYLYDLSLQYPESFFTWKSADVLPLYMGAEVANAEIARAKDRMDDAIFRQEFEAEFIHFDSRAYYNFEHSIHTEEGLPYDIKAPLHLAFDFNVEPGVAVVIQEGLEQNLKRERDDMTFVIGSVTIEKNSTTPTVCRKLIEDWGNHQGQIFLYGDATGGARGSAKVAGSDWDIIKEMFRAKWQGRIHMRVPRSNPRERPRINAVNSRLKSSTGKVRMKVDKRTAAPVATDLDETPIIKGSAGEIDKKANPDRTHHTDALGYYVIRQHPIGGGYKFKHQPI